MWVYMRNRHEWQDDWRRDVDRRSMDVRVAGVDLMRSDPMERAAWAGRRLRRYGRHHHHGFPWPLLVLAFFFLGGGGLFTALVLAALTAVFALVCVALALHFAAPGLSRTIRVAFSGGARTADPVYEPASLSGRYAAGQLTQDEFRRQLIDLLKQRYVRGELTTAEYEDHLGRILRDPVA